MIVTAALAAAMPLSPPRRRGFCGRLLRFFGDPAAGCAKDYVACGSAQAGAAVPQGPNRRLAWAARITTVTGLWRQRVVERRASANIIRRKTIMNVCFGQS